MGKRISLVILILLIVSACVPVSTPTQAVPVPPTAGATSDPPTATPLPTPIRVDLTLGPKGGLERAGDQQNSSPQTSNWSARKRSPGRMAAWGCCSQVCCASVDRWRVSRSCCRRLAGSTNTIPTRTAPACWKPSSNWQPSGWWCRARITAFNWSLRISRSAQPTTRLLMACSPMGLHWPAPPMCWISPNWPKPFLWIPTGCRSLHSSRIPTMAWRSAWWPNVQARLAWGTQPINGAPSSLQTSALDGSQLETLVTQAAGSNLPIQLVALAWSADGQTLYFSKEPVGIGGYIPFSGASSLYQIDIGTKKVTELIPFNVSTRSFGCLDALSGDYRFVADHCTPNTLTIRDLSSGASSPHPTARIGGRGAPAWKRPFQPGWKTPGLCPGRG